MATATTATPAASATFLTTPQVAKRLGVNADKVLNWIRRGELRAINITNKIGGKRPRYRVAESDLAAFLTSRAAVPDAPATRGRSRRKQRAGFQEFIPL
jgi:excisionase family DNA binding protein